MGVLMIGAGIGIVAAVAALLSGGGLLAAVLAYSLGGSAGSVLIGALVVLSGRRARMRAWMTRSRGSASRPAIMAAGDAPCRSTRRPSPAFWS